MAEAPGADTPPAAATTRGLVAACLAASLMPLNSTMIAVAVPGIAAELERTTSTVTQALVAPYLVAAIALQSPGGKLGDRFGHWRAFAVGLAVLLVGALLGFLAPTLWLLAVSRVLMAAGGAIVVPTTIALLRAELPAERQGRAFGIFGSVMSLAAATGPLVGGVLIRAFDWPSIFLANVPILLAAAALAASAHRMVIPRTDRQFDWAGSALLAAGLGCLVSALEIGGSSVGVLVGAGVVLFVAFALVERRVTDPVVSFSLFRDRRFAAGSLVIALFNLVMYALLFEIPIVLARVLQLAAEQIGPMLLALTLAMMFTSPAAGRLTDRVGPRPVAAAGALAGLAGIGAMWMSSGVTAQALVPALVLLGVGIGLSSPAAQTASLAGIDRRDSGMAAGVNSTMRYLGGIAGVAILGQTLDTSRTPAEVVVQHHHLLLTFGGVLLVALVCSLLLGQRPSRWPSRAEGER